MNRCIILCLTVLVSLVPDGNAFAIEPVAVSPGSESGVAVVGQSCPTFSWGAVEGALSYEAAVFEMLTIDVLSYTESNNLSNPVIRKKIPVPALSWTPSSELCLTNKGTYVWYVRGLDWMDEGIWSEGKVFEIDTTMVSGEVEETARQAVESYMETQYFTGEVFGNVKSAGRRANELARRKTGAVPGKHERHDEGIHVTDNPGYPGGLSLAEEQEAGGGAGLSLEIGSIALATTTAADIGIILKGGGSFIHDFHDSGTDGDNVFIGKGAGNFTMGGDTFYAASRNTGIGLNSLSSNTTGYQNTAYGSRTLVSNTTGHRNTAIGSRALVFNTGGSENTAIGFHALLSNTTGYHNVGLGAYANLFNETGSNNTIVGYEAGAGQETITHKSGNVLLGYRAGFNETGSNKLYIENSDASTPLIGGDFAADEVYLNGSVGIGTANPGHKLDVVGNVFIRGTDGFNAQDEDAVLHFGHVGHAIRGEYGTGVVINAFGAPNALTVGEGNGNVSIGAYFGPGGTPPSRLYVSDFASTGDILSVSNSTASGTMVFQGTGELGVGTLDPVYNLEVAGSAGKPGGGSWSDSSDRRLKKNIKNLTGALDKLTALKGISFEWINPEVHGQQTAPRAGLIAQDVEKVFPAWISDVEPAGRDLELVKEGEKAKALQFPHDFNAYLIEAIKELKAENESLRARTQDLDARIAKVETLLTGSQ